MRQDKWIKRWKINGSNGNIWTVAIDKEDNYGCSCPIWKFKRQECRHITQVKNNGGELKELPKVSFGQVHQVKQVNEEVLIPLVAVGDTHMSASNGYILLKMGYPTDTIRYYSEAAKNNSLKAIENYILHHGVKIWDKETFYDKIKAPKTKIVPIEKYYINQDN